MFGYVTANELELKMKDFHEYRSYYCGLCQSLKTRYGISGQLTLTYDMTFVILLLTSLYECETKSEEHRCAVHPVKKRVILQNEITDYAADMNLILAYFHLKDDWEDEKKLTALAGGRMMLNKVKKAMACYPRQCEVIQKELRNLSEYERQDCMEIDVPAGCFGRLMEEILVYKKDCWEDKLRRMGFYLGKFIYIMDAYEDLPKDIEKHSYNPLKEMVKEDGYEARCKEILFMMMGECAAAFEQLPCIQNIDILRNILYDGVWKRYQKLQEKSALEKSEEE